MGSGAKTAHKSYVVTPASKPDVAVVIPETELPFEADSAVFNPADYLEAEGFDWPVDAGPPFQWYEQGFGPGGVAAYVGNGITDPADAKVWFEHGFGPVAAGGWAGAGFSVPGAEAWHAVGYLPDEAKAHATVGHTPIDAVASTAKLIEVAHAGEAIADDVVLESDFAKCPSCGQWTSFAELPDTFVCPHCGFDAFVSTLGGETLPELDEDGVDYDIVEQLSPEALVEAAEEAIALDEPIELAQPSAQEFADVAPATTVAGAGKVSDQAWHESVTSVPDIVPLGDPRGVPLLLGGADLEKGSATIMSYADPGKGPAHEVLFCTINEQAEQKLLEALAPTEQKLIEKKVVNTYTGRLDTDKEEAIYENLLTAAKSINTHLKAGDGMPAHTIERVQTVSAKLAAMKAAANPALNEMITFYEPLVSALSDRIDPAYGISYDNGGKTPQITAFETTWDKEEIEWVPDLSEPTGEAKLAASARPSSRVDPHIKDGRAEWNGKSRTPGKGIEYVIQLPGGYEAIYHPYVYQGQNLSHDDFSLRGQLELHCPGGEGHAKQLVDVLGSLNIVNRPMNGAEAEWTYLEQNIIAQGLSKHPTVRKAIESSADLEKNVGEKLMIDHAHEAIGMDDKQINDLAQRLTLEAEASALPLRVRIVRDAFAKALGIGSGQDLVDHPDYHPMPRQSGGWMVFDRFDVISKRDQVVEMFKDKKIGVHVTGQHSQESSLLAIFRNGGVLASTERRRIMGAKKGSGMSESADMTSGGAKSTFVRIHARHGSEGGGFILWHDPVRLLRRTDWYGAPHDTFGSENSASHHSASSRTTDLSKVAHFGGNNELMFRDGLDLLGVDAPSKVVCTSASERDAIRKLIKSQGIKELGGAPVDDVIVTAG